MATERVGTLTSFVNHMEEDVASGYFHPTDFAKVSYTTCFFNKMNIMFMTHRQMSPLRLGVG